MAQPSNTDISIFYTVRAQREFSRQDSVKDITGKLRPLVLVAPGEEFTSGYGATSNYKFRQAGLSDFSPVMGSAAAGAVRGLPRLVKAGSVRDFSVVQTIVGVDFPVAIGQDKFVSLNAANVAADLQADARGTAVGTTL